MKKTALSALVPATFTAALAAALLAGCATSAPTPADTKAAAPAAKPAPKLRPTQRVDAFIKSIDNNKNNFSNRIVQVAALLEEPDFATNAVNRAYIREKIAEMCFTPPWTKITLWDPNLKYVYLLPNVRAILDDPELPAGNKLGAAAKLARFLAGEGRFDEAEKVARDAIALPGLGERIPDHKGRALFILADVYRWQDRYDEAMAALMEAMKTLPEEAARKACSLAFDFDHADRIPEIWKAADKPFAEFDYYTNERSGAGKYGDLLPGFDDARRRALAYVLTTTNAPANRLRAVRCFFLNGRDADSKKAIASLRGADFSWLRASDWSLTKQITELFTRGDYARFVELCEILDAAPLVATAPLRLARVSALGAVGREKDGAALAAKFAADEALFKPAERAWLAAAAAILSGKPGDGVVEAANLPPDDRATVYANLAGACHTWGRADLAEAFAAKHEALFVPPPKRVSNVFFSETPIDSAEVLRRVWPQLDVQRCDATWRGSLQFLETDVATGVRRDIAVDKEGKPFSFMEIATACDVKGVHVFLRLETDQARAIERGFGQAGSCETYFAPGVGQPYTCVGVGPRGLEYSFPTTYDNANHRRLDTTGRKAATSFSAKTYYTDQDYTIHLFYAWNPFAGKLPAPGAEWRFECISAQPFGRYTWGGSQGVHNASAWGSLRFDLTPEQLTAIRRRLLYATFRSYANISFAPSATMNVFEYWKDPGVGDRAFYDKCLAPLEAELKGYAARVKEDMSDAEVNEVFSKGLVRWINLRDTIEGLHRRYLAEKFTE